MAVVTLYGNSTVACSGKLRSWNNVQDGSVMRSGDGSMTFKFTDTDMLSRRVTLYGVYTIEYDPEVIPNKLNTL